MKFSDPAVRSSVFHLKGALFAAHEGKLKMNRSYHILTNLLALTVASTALAAGGGPYAMKNTLKIGADGRWDLVAVNPATHLLYVPRSTHTQVIDPSTG